MENKNEPINDRSLLELCESVKENVIAVVYNHEFLIHLNVFNPVIFIGADFFVECLIKIVKDFNPKYPTLLDIGTGAGYNGILAVLNGAFHATATDVNQCAVQNAKENVKNYNLEGKITVLQSDIFDSLKPDEKFDIIFWNIPIGFIDKPTQELSFIERSLYDPHSILLDRYLKDAYTYLAPDVGRLFITYSETHGDMDDFQRIASKYKWRITRLYDTYLSKPNMVHFGFYELSKIH